MSEKRRGLGRGLGALIPDQAAARARPVDVFFADRDERIKLVHVKLRNEGLGTRRLRAIADSASRTTRLARAAVMSAWS